MYKEGYIITVKNASRVRIHFHPEGYYLGLYTSLGPLAGRAKTILIPMVIYTHAISL